jgi:MarR family transcriptional regulator, lower aerobic nicotinate degradation pathway regulator
VLGSEKSAMVRTVDDLERLGAAVRLPDPGDRRVRLVGLTSTGRDLLDQAQTLASDAAEDLFSVLSDDQQRQLRQLLSLMTGRTAHPETQALTETGDRAPERS